MTKKQLFNFFQKKISTTAIIKRGGENIIIGKFCIISVEDNGLIDIWICNPIEISSGLSQRLTRNKLSEIKHRGMIAFEVLTGEGYVRTFNKEAVTKNLKLLGIRKKAEYTPEQVEQMAATLMRNTR